MTHLDMSELLAAARSGTWTQHLDDCSFCREQYQLAVEFLAFSPDTVQQEDERGQGAAGQALPGRKGYRLAAQTAQAVSPMFRLRRTWYLDNNARILRVIEDLEEETLTGFFISEHGGKEHVHIRFDGIEQDFSPDHNGVFSIGPASIDIEPMQVSIRVE